MLDSKKILVVVPARGGSKGIPLKNLRTVLGVSLVARVGNIIAEIPEIDRAVISTDHEEIAKVARESGLDAPFLRPPYLSGDTIGDLDVLTHALNEMENIDDTQYDIIVMLQPTSPLRKAKHVVGTIEMLVRKGWDAIWTVSETDSKAHPLKQLVVNDDGNMDFYDDQGALIIARQQLQTLYHRNGAAYAITRDCLLNQKSIMGKYSGAFIIDEPMISIDTEWDLALVETLMLKETANTKACPNHGHGN
ncbi:acylneuraminate cytidylyltransferase family protein [Magnetovibrio blakemorei]|uniref:CMP-N-acetylneuraminic acid synthetase n=1 Tax=Magnetovibrio blakemorei TaxID=28181 RepID=A0A1E5Q5Y1_9PROT|nr:acylneuraminate cytidylyltransferase family protein [Magnetovibrio blakemorei]OEJ66116.1 CMP-N-acetylneuraminic acid synthetase [Magnetovibrio blakemorei]